MQQNFLTLKQLESARAEYLAIAPTLRQIADLCAGGHTIEAKKAQYLKPRPGEEEDLYKIRLDKFVYTNVLGDAIASQVQKLASGSLNLSGVDENERSQKFWQKFRENTNRKGRKEKDLLGEIFEQILQYRTCWAHIEKPYSPIAPINQLQEEMLGLMPYVCLYSPLEVISWDEDDAGELAWVKVRQIREVPNLLGKSLTKATWTLIDRTSISKYEAFIKLNKLGKISEIVDAKGEPIESGEDAKVPALRSPILHGFGRVPIVKIEVPQKLWVADQAYLLALEHLNLENSRYDTAMMAGYVQRTWQPHQTPDTDLDHTFVDSPDQLKTGNQYVIKGSFAFNEAQGSSIATVSGLLDSIKDAIEDMIGTARASASRGGLQQSGVSKAMDFSLQESALKKYGQILCDAYQNLLQLVARSQGLPNPESISVTGLDTFDVDSLDGMVAIATAVAPIESRLAPTALKLFYQNLQAQLVKNASAQQQQEMVAESETLWQQLQVMQAVAMLQQNSDKLDASNK